MNKYIRDDLYKMKLKNSIILFDEGHNAPRNARK